MNYAEQLTVAWAALPCEQDALVEAARATFWRERDQLPSLLRKYAEQARDPTRGVGDAFLLWHQVELLALPGEYAAIEKLTGIKCQNNAALFGAWARKQIRAHRKVPNVMLTLRRAKNSWLRRVPWDQLTPFEWWVIYRSIVAGRAEAASSAAYLVEPISRTLNVIGYLIQEHSRLIERTDHLNRVLRFVERFGVRNRLPSLTAIDTGNETHFLPHRRRRSDAEWLMQPLVHSLYAPRAPETNKDDRPTD